MKILVLYASEEGQTAKIAQAVGRQIAAAGHQAVAANIGEPFAKVDLGQCDQAVLAAPVHERRHPQAFEVFIAANRTHLAEMKTLLLSVSLNAAFADGIAEARDYVDEMEMRTGFKANDDVLVAGAMRPRSYDYYETQVVRHTLMGARPHDPADGPREFTDWDALAKSVEAFLP